MRRRTLLACGAATLVAPRAWAEDNDHVIARIGNDLRPLFAIRGEPVAPTSMQSRMAEYAVPGVSVAFFDDKRVLWAKQYGVVDQTTKTPVSASTIFQASSITKVVTTLATLRLVRERKINLDEDVNRTLARWKVPDNEFTSAEKVTVRRLLSHNAGVTVHGFSGYDAGAELPTTLQILAGAKPANSPPIIVDKTPGAGFRYSGGGYVILQQLIEEITGQPFAEAITRLVLAPAGMRNSTMLQPLSPALKKQAAAGHATDGAALPGGSAVFPELAPAGLWSTPTDIAKMAIEITREAEGASSRILDSSPVKC